MIRINFSGHPVDGFELSPLVGVNLSSNGQELAEQIREVVSSLPQREDLLRGAAAEIVLPGFSQATGTLLAEWHGQFGGFPTVRWAVRGAEGFSWPDTAKLNLADVRLQARKPRC